MWNKLKNYKFVQHSEPYAIALKIHGKKIIVHEVFYMLTLNKNKSPNELSAYEGYHKCHSFMVIIRFIIIYNWTEISIGMFIKWLMFVDWIHIICRCGFCCYAPSPSNPTNLSNIVVVTLFLARKLASTNKTHLEICVLENFRALNLTYDPVI